MINLKIEEMEHPLGLFGFCPRCGSSRFVENDTKSKKCMDCEFVFYLNAATAVAAIIVNDRREMLLCRRRYNPYKGSLALPGGFVDLNESAENAVRREIHEETGAETETIQYFDSFPNIYPYSGFEVRTLDMIFICSLKKNSVLVPNDDVSEIIFIPIEEIKPEDIKLSSIQKAVKKWLMINSDKY